MPWEYVNFDDILVDLKASPNVLDVPIPRYFKEELQEEQRARDKLVQALKAVKLGDDGTLALEEECEIGVSMEMTVEEAVECLQRCERGRQGIIRAQLVDGLQQRESTKVRDIVAFDIDPEIAASNIQRIFRGRNSRKAASKQRDDELRFIGMERAPEWEDKEAKLQESKLQEEIEYSRSRRKAEQKENEQGYSKSLIELHGRVLDEEGPEMREAMMDDRRAWFTDELGKGQFPDDLTGYYLMKNPPPEEEEKIETDKKGKKADTKKKDDKKKGKGAVEPEVVEKIPPLSGPSLFSSTINETLDRYEDLWLERDETENFQQKHDVKLAKNVVRPNVEEEVRENVDRLLLLQLQNLKAQLEAAAGSKKGKKKKDKKGKKGKKGKKDKKKGKPLPGEKLCADMELEQMLSILVENRIVAEIQPSSLDDLVGEFNYLGTAYQQHSETKDAWGNWVPQDPTISQIRNTIIEKIILPVGAPFLRVVAPYSKSLLLYGDSGSGKTTIARAIASHTNALFLNVSPAILDNVSREFKEGKSGPTKLMHMIFTVARSPQLGPSVIYMDQIDKMFVGKKKGAGGDATKFRKDFVTYSNSLKPEDRAIIVGCTSEPFNIPDGEFKDIKAVFNCQLYLPIPDYASRVLLWRKFLEVRFAKFEMDLPTSLDVSSLATVSHGYSPGSIKKCINETLSHRRIIKLQTSELASTEFLNCLASLPLTYQDRNLKFQQFTAAISGLQDRRDKIKAMKECGGDEKDKKKKK